MLSNKNLASAGSKNPVCDFHACDHFLYSARKSHGPKEKMYFFWKTRSQRFRGNCETTHMFLWYELRLKNKATRASFECVTAAYYFYKAHSKSTTGLDAYVSCISLHNQQENIFSLDFEVSWYFINTRLNMVFCSSHCTPG